MHYTICDTKCILLLLLLFCFILYEIKFSLQSMLEEFHSFEVYYSLLKITSFTPLIFNYAGTLHNDLDMEVFENEPILFCKRFQSIL